MHNMVYLVGRMSNNFKEVNKDVYTFKIAVQRDYADEHGIYEVDVITCVVNKSLLTEYTELARKGDLIGVRGSLQEGKVHLNEFTVLSTKKVV